MQGSQNLGHKHNNNFNLSPGFQELQSSEMTRPGKLRPISPNSKCFAKLRKRKISPMLLA